MHAASTNQIADILHFNDNYMFNDNCTTLYLRIVLWNPLTY